MKKISFKKISTLIKNNYAINRTVPFILFIAVLTISSLIGAIPVSSVESGYDYAIKDKALYADYLETMDELYDAFTGIDGIYSAVFIFAALILAFLSALSLNSYMREKSSCDFYHSIAVNRRELFLSSFITAFINSAITIIAAQWSAIFFMSLFSTYKPMGMLELFLSQTPTLLLILLFLFIFLAIAMIATVASGTVFASVINYGVLMFYAPLTILIVAGAGDIFFNSPLFEYLEHYPNAYAYGSPFLFYIQIISGAIELNALTVIALFLAGILTLLFGMWIYSQKKNENSGKPLPFNRAARPIQYLLTFDAILLGSMFFDVITGDALWTIVGGLLALFFSFILFNAFVDRSFNGVFRKPRHMAIMLSVTLLLSAVFVADCFSIYKKPSPVEKNIIGGYMDVTFDDDEKQQTFVYNVDEIDIQKEKELRSELFELWKIAEEDIDSNYTDGKSLSIYMSVQTKGDTASYYENVYISPDNPEYQRVLEAINDFLEKYPPSENRIYYYNND